MYISVYLYGVYVLSEFQQLLFHSIPFHFISTNQMSSVVGGKGAKVENNDVET